jgi:nicotinate-nucleotide adenylyltransferase
MTKASRRIGIYAGSFDPIHVGHITFALQALQIAKLDKLYFLPERSPWSKQAHELFGHRSAMITRAIKPYRKFEVLELDDKHFTVAKTIPKLKAKFASDELVYLFGSDVIKRLNSWPGASTLLEKNDLVIGVREGDNAKSLKKESDKWKAKNIIYIDSFASKVASTKIRSALTNQQKADGLLSSVAKYIRNNWLYISLN